MKSFGKRSRSCRARELSSEKLRLPWIWKTPAQNQWIRLLLAKKMLGERSMRRENRGYPNFRRHRRRILGSAVIGRKVAKRKIAVVDFGGCTSLLRTVKAPLGRYSAGAAEWVPIRREGELNKIAPVMKYSPQQQQKERKSESDVCSIEATPNRAVRRHSASTDRKDSSSSASRRSALCRSPSTGMFAWMRVFRLASMLHQVGC
ncbi:hypothetical protein KM043_014846 [Ampulex compressa]|nr:hypothetical protein KM043_014846 [Ampulex compressa]